MDIFYPFIYEPKTKKKELEPEFLYIEIAPPQKEPKLDIEKEDENIIIIQL